MDRIEVDIRWKGLTVSHHKLDFLSIRQIIQKSRNLGSTRYDMSELHAVKIGKM